MEEENIIETKQDNVEGETKIVRRRMKKTYQAILQQMEFYFSDANLNKDRYLHSLVSEDPYVDLSVFLKFNKIRALTDNVEDIANALRKSEFLTLSSDRTKVCRETPIKPNYNEDECSIYVENLPPDAKHEWLKDVFSAYGKVAYVSIPKYRQSGKIKGFAFVEFESQEVANKVLEEFGAAGCCLPSDMAPEQLCSVTTFEPGEGKNQVGYGKHPTELEKDDAEEDSRDANEGEMEEEAEEVKTESIATLSKDKKKKKWKKDQSDEEEDKPEDEEEEKQSEKECPSPVPKKRKIKKEKDIDEEGQPQEEGEEEKQLEKECPSPVPKKKKIKKEKDKDEEEDQPQEDDEEDENISAAEESSSAPSKDKERRKRKKDEDVEEEEQLEEAKKARLEEESATEIENGEEQKERKKKTRKKRNKNKKEKLAEEAVGLHILSKREWKRLRNKYLTLQRKNMKNLRKQIMGGRWGNYWGSDHGGNGKEMHCEEWDEDNEKDMEHSEDHGAEHSKAKEEKTKSCPRVQFTPGVIIKIQLKEPLESAKKFKTEVKNLPKSDAVAYVDARDAATVSHIRCETAEGARDLLENLPWENRELLEGEEEKEYWNKILKDRDEKITKKIRVKQRGRDKILKKAENLIGKHVRYEN